MSFRYSEAFLDSYKTREPKWGPVGFIVYKRTYARWIPSKQRTEHWWETVRRVLEGNASIVPDDPTITTEYMEAAYDHMWNMRWLPAGRGLWISGTDTARKVSSSLVNCWGRSIQPAPYFLDDPNAPFKASTPFVFAMDKLMLGGGVGTNVTKEVVSNFPEVAGKVDLHIVCDPRHDNFREVKAVEIPPRDSDHTYIRVTDDRRGWTDALRVVIDAHFKRINYDYKLIIDVSDIRPYGRRIKGFGGVASGPGPLVELLREVNSLLNNVQGRKLSPIEAADIVGYTAKCIVSGNVRRSALIHLGSSDDKDFYESKLDPVMAQSVRWTANISIAIDDVYDAYESLVEAIATNGEPGIVNLERCQNYGRFADGLQPGIDAKSTTVNPCSEITLDGELGEPCNLVELFPYVIESDGHSLEEVALYAFHYAKRVTSGNYDDWQSSAKVISENRRIGVGISGWEDWKAYLTSKGLSSEDRQQKLDSLYKALKAEDASYSELLGIPQSIKITTIKPSGSISKLNGSSAGRHPHYAPYIIQRIRFAETDPLIDMLRDAGFRMEQDYYSPNTLCVEFPVKAPTADLEGFKSASDYSLEDHFKDQLELQHWWADNSVSSTLTFVPEEKDLIPDLLRKYKLKSTSLLPFSDHAYKQPPWEPITAEEYEARVEEIKFMPAEQYMSKEVRDMELIGDSECEGGSCPVR